MLIQRFLNNHFQLVPIDIHFLLAGEILSGKGGMARFCVGSGTGSSTRTHLEVVMRLEEVEVGFF